MRKVIISVVGILAISCFGYVDTLTFDVYNSVTQALVESVIVTLDTAGTEACTVLTDANGQAAFALDKDETFLFRFYKRGTYYKDSLIFVYTASDTTGGKDEIDINMKYFLDPVGAKYNVVAHNDSDNDSNFAPVESVWVDIVNSSDDTLFEGYTDSLGNFPFDPESLTTGQTYWVYVTDADSVYVNDYKVFVHTAGTEKNISIEMDSLSAITTNTITANVINWSGYPIRGVTANVTIATPMLYGTGTDTKIITNTTSTRSYTSDSDGNISIIVPDNSIVNIAIPEAFGYVSGYFYCSGDTTLGQIGIK